MTFLIDIMGWPSRDTELHLSTCILIASPVCVADLKAFATDSGVLILQEAVNGHTQCSCVFPKVLSPRSSQVLQACAPECCFMLHKIAFAGKSTVVSRSIPLLMKTPSGVSTFIPIGTMCDVYVHF